MEKNDLRRNNEEIMSYCYELVSAKGYSQKSYMGLHNPISVLQMLLNNLGN